MARRVIVHSFHSQVPQTLTKLDEEPDTIVALDSHMDVYLGTKEVLELIPEDIQLAATRASAHTTIRRTFGELPALMRAQGLPTDFIPDMYLVVPHASMDAHLFEMYIDLQYAIMRGRFTPDHFPAPEEGFRNYLTKVLGIQLYISPPKNLLKLVRVLRGGQNILFDLDVDYLQELQNECYTPLKGAQPGQLGSIDRVLRIIHRAKPFLITVSEGKLKALQDPASNYSRLIGKLGTMGYKVRYSHMLTSDNEAERLIKVYEEYDKQVRKPLQDRWLGEKDSSSSGNYERLIDELREATQKYFRTF